MSDPNELAIRAALTELNAAFTYHLDRNEIDPLVDLFTAHAVYTHGERRSEGREEIRALFEARARRGPRTTRHLVSGLQLAVADEAEASGHSICLLFAADSLAPVTGPLVPTLLADFVDAYSREADGQWRIARRDIRRIFVAR